MPRRNVLHKAFPNIRLSLIGKLVIGTFNSHRQTSPTYTSRLTTYNLQLTTYDLQLMTYNLSLKTPKLLSP